jgi:hypothetical protein
MAVLNFYHIGKQIPENAVYIGRRNLSLNLQQSPFANPFKLTKETDRETVIEQYKTWLWNNIKSGKITIQSLKDLKDKDLVCYCHPKACHGHVLEKAIKWACTLSDEEILIYQKSSNHSNKNSFKI